MNISVFLGIIVFVACFGGILYLNSESEGSLLFFTPPYNYVVGDAFSYLNAFLFVFVLSAAFFGIASPIALGIEGLKYASLLSGGFMPVYDILFVIPQIFAAYSAAMLGKGAIEDYQGKGNVFSPWKNAVKWFVVGLVSLIVLIVARNYL